jgi:hypothetical protein
MSRNPQIEHYLERALDNTAIVAALSSARADSTPELEQLAERQDTALYDLIHEFAFNARKVIELVEREGLPSAAIVREGQVGCLRADEGSEPDTECEISLKQIVNLIIHSDEFEIDRDHVPVPEGNESRTTAAWGFIVRSNPPRGKRHFVWIAFMLAEFLRFEQHLRKDLPVLRLER